MIQMTRSEARAKFFQLDQYTNAGSPIHVKGKTSDSNLVIVSESEWEDTQETLYLSNNLAYKQSLIDGKNEAWEDGVTAESIGW